VIALSLEAESQIDRLIAHYETKGRVGATVNLLNAIERAKYRIATRPEAGLDAPRPYPGLKLLGRRWIIEGSYWICYGQTNPPVISGVYYLTADIPNRI
jgi:plasmid stabilization system protein ParE